MFSSYRVGSQHLQVWLSRLQQLGHHVQETLHEGFDALRVTRHQQLVQSLHGYHHIPAHSNKLYTQDTGAFQHLHVYRNTTPDVCHRGRGLSRDTQTLPNPLPPNVLTEQFFEALLYLKTEAAKGGDERLVLNRGRCSRCVSIKIHKKSGTLLLLHDVTLQQLHLEGEGWRYRPEHANMSPCWVNSGPVRVRGCRAEGRRVCSLTVILRETTLEPIQTESLTL